MADALRRRDGAALAALARLSPAHARAVARRRPTRRPSPAGRHDDGVLVMDANHNEGRPFDPTDPRDPAYLRVTNEAPADQSDAHVLAGFDALNDWHRAKEAAKTARLRAAALTRGWAATPPDPDAQAPYVETASSDDALIVRPVSAWMDGAAAALPTPRPLLGSLWFEGEMTVLFSETNAGKSVLAVQVADAVARGRGTLGLPCEGDRRTCSTSTSSSRPSSSSPGTPTSPTLPVRPPVPPGGDGPRRPR